MNLMLGSIQTIQYGGRLNMVRGQEVINKSKTGRGGGRGWTKNTILNKKTLKINTLVNQEIDFSTNRYNTKASPYRFYRIIFSKRQVQVKQA